MKDWIRDATASLPDEVERLNPMLPPSVRTGIVSDTASTDEESQALYRRLRNDSRVELRRPRRWVPALLFGGGALLAASAAAAVVTALVVMPDAGGPQPEALATVALEAGQSVPLGPSIQVTGVGTLTVDRLHDSGADVTLDSGLARFEVDPAGTARHLVVSAADVQVTVKGTVFSVERLTDDVAVRVERGEVAVAWPDGDIRLSGGQAWRLGDGVADESPASAQPPTEPSEPAASGAGDAAPHLPSTAPAVPGSPPAPIAAATPSEAATPGIAEPGASAPMGVAAPAAGETVSAADPCVEDSFSLECARSRAKRHDQSPEQRFAALQRAMVRVGQAPDDDRRIVQDCDTFLTQHGATQWADDVRAFRVEAAFHGSRSSTVVRVADAYLAAAAADHAERAQVQRWRDIANLRMTTLDMAQRGECDDALPMLRDLSGLESGVRAQEALAWRGICAAKTGARDEARNVLRNVREEDLAPALRQRVRDAWALIP